MSKSHLISNDLLLISHLCSKVLHNVNNPHRKGQKLQFIALMQRTVKSCISSGVIKDEFIALTKPAAE